MLCSRDIFKGLMSLLVAFSSVSMLLAQPAINNSEVKVSARILEESVPLNRQAHLVVQAQWSGQPDQITLQPLEPPALTNFKIISTASANRVQAQGDQLITVRRYEFVLQPQTIGMAYVDEVLLHYQDETGQTHSLQTPRLQIKIVDPVAGPRKNLIGPIAFGGALLLLLAAGLVLVWNQRTVRRVQEAQARQKSQPPGEAFAARLRSEVALQADDLALQYGRLADVVRGYLHEVLPVGKSAGTTQEWLSVLEGEGFALDERTLVQEILQACDLVKFSGAPADPNQLARLYTLAESFFKRRSMEAAEGSESRNSKSQAPNPK